jgi:ribulose-phosphate 3-epimerase
MRYKLLISPSILAADFSKLGEEIKRAEGGGADMIHVDVMDGHFVPNITIGPVVVEYLRKVTELTLDVHLMIENPEKYIDAFLKAGADIITIHYEVCGARTNEVIEYIKNKGIKAAVAFNPDVNIDEAVKCTDNADMVLMMSVFPGFGGQKFIRDVLWKIKKLCDYRENNGFKFNIQVDGGIDSGNIGDVTEAGANVIVAGTSVFRAADINIAIKELRDNASKLLT